MGPDRRRARAVALAAALAATAVPVRGGPCTACPGPFGPVPTGWWHDRPLSPAGGDARAPRIEVAERFGQTRIAVVWEDRTAGEGDIWLARSNDGGCSFEVAPVTSGPGDDRLPDVAFYPRWDFLAVAFLRDGAPMVTVSRDLGDTFAAPERIDPAATVTGRLRLALAPAGTRIHLHAAWEQGDAIGHARSLDGGAAGSWVASGAPLSARFFDLTGFAGPDLAADTRSVDPAVHSAVTLAFAARSGAGERAVHVVRSNDSGATFFGDPLDPATLDRPRRVSDAGAGEAAAVAADTNDDGSGVFEAWTALGWAAGAAPSSLPLLDARAEEGSGPTRIADWNDPPASADIQAGSGPGRVAALAVVPNPLGRPPVPDLHVVLEDAAGGGDLAAGRGLLDPGATPTVNLYCPPVALTGRFPPRPAGSVEPGSAAADEDASNAFVVWVDGREGVARIWWKRTDGFTDPPQRVTASPRPCAQGGGLDVAWDPPAAPPHCDVDRYRIEWGPGPGDYTGSVELSGPGPLAGLLPATTYWLRVVTIDEACNEEPSPEVQATTPDCPPAPRCPAGTGNTLRAVRRSGVDVALEWAPPPVDPLHDAATSYDVWRAAGRPASPWAPLAAVADPAWTDPAAAGPASPDPRLFYRIVARNACGTSGDEPPR